MKHLDRIHTTAAEHPQATIYTTPTPLDYISYRNGQFTCEIVLRVDIRGADGSYSRSFENAIIKECVR